MKRSLSLIARRAAAVLLAALLTVSAVAVGLTPKASAVAYDNSNRFYVTVYWRVDNDNSNENNRIAINYFQTVNPSSSESCYSSTGTVTVERAAASNGAHSQTFELPGPPSSIDYKCWGKTADVSKWYLTKVTVAPIDPVTGAGETVTYWEGSVGLEMKQVGGNSNSHVLYFKGNVSDVITRWENDMGAAKEAYTTSTYSNFKPVQTSATEPGGDSVIYVPTDGGTRTVTFSPSVLCDQYGASWPCQERFASIIQSNGDVRIIDLNTIEVLPTANSRNDYNLTYKQRFSGTDVSGLKTLTFKTFDYNVTFKNWDGTVLKTQTVDYDASATPPTATRPSTDTEVFTFSGWTGDSYRSIRDGAQNRTVTANYTSAARTYTITWLDGDGSTLKTEQYEYNQTPAYDGTMPTKAATEQYVYTFSGWSPAIGPVTEDQTYTPVFSSTEKYLITWKNDDGTTLRTERILAGQTPSYGTAPTKAADEKYSYTFRGWNPAVAPAAADAVYTATYTRTPLASHFAANGNTYTIRDKTGWEIFCELVQDDAYNGFAGKTVSLDASITGAATTAGTRQKPFKGAFVGNGNTLNVNLADTANQGTAPFRAIGSGATISDLTVTGTVAGGLHAAGLVGFSEATAAGQTNRIDNCTVSAAVSNTATSGNRHIGGVVGHGLSNALEISNTVFDGTMSNTGSYAGGLLGWCDGGASLTLDSCISAGTYSGSGQFHPVAVRYNNANIGTPTVNEVYYTAAPTLTNAANIAATGAQASETLQSGFTTPYTLRGKTIYTASPIFIGAHSLTLNGDIGVNFYADIPRVTEDAYAAFTVNGETVTVPIDLNSFTVLNGITLYRFSCNVAAAQIDTEITGRIVNGQDSSDAFTYSVQTYLTEAQTTMADKAAFMALAGSLATYGYYANALFGLDPDFAQHALFDDSGFAAVTAASLAGKEAQIEDTENGVRYYGSSLVLRTETAIRHYFRLPAGRSIDDFTFLLNGDGAPAALTPKANGGYYYVEIPDIASGKLGTAYTVTVADSAGETVNTWQYSALSYVFRVLTKAEAGDPSVSNALADVSRALTLYSQAADAYFSQPDA